MNERVLLVRTTSSGTEYRIDGNEYVFGKAPAMCNGVIAESGAVSRTHCRFIRLSDGGYGVEDLHSANGTRLNGYHLEPGSVYPLQEGDSLTIADVECQVFYCAKHALNRNQRNGACAYKAVLYNSLFHIEIPFDDMGDEGITIGTYPACTYRFHREDFSFDFYLHLSFDSFGNYAVSAYGGIEIAVDGQTDSSQFLLAGRNYQFRPVGSEETLFSLIVEADFPEAGTDFDVYIDIRMCGACTIGAEVQDTIRIDDPNIEGTLTIEEESDGCRIRTEGENPGLKINGAAPLTDSMLVRRHEFFSFFGHMFCVEDHTLYTSRFTKLSTELPYGMEATSENHISYPRYIRNVRQRYGIDDTEIPVLDPKQKDESEETNLLVTLMPLLLNMMIMVVLRGVVGGGGAFVLYCGATMLVSGGVSIFGSVKELRTRRQREKDRTEKYMQYIGQKEDTIIAEREQEKILATYMYPDAHENLDKVKVFDNRLFQQDFLQEDFLRIRIGTGIVRSKRQVGFKEEEYVETEDELMDYPRILHEKYEYLADMPVMLSIKECSAVGFIGTRNRLYRMMKNLIVQLATTHFYRDVRFFFILDEEDEALFSWARWLQNLQREPYPERNFIYDEESRKTGLEYLYDELARREGEKNIQEEYVVFVYRSDVIRRHPVSDHVAHAAKLGFHFLFFEEYEELLDCACEKRIFLHDREQEGYIQDTENGTAIQAFSYPYISTQDAAAMAKKLSCVYVDEVSLENSLTKNITLYQLLHIHTPYELDLIRRWSDSRIDESMAAPLGVKTGNEIVCLDLHEKAHGPHGLVAGTTGSGKSEIIQSYILSMATLFHPYEIGFVIVDFKGGGMANQFEQLPHLIGTITNMDGDEIDRSLLSIRAELLKRQALFAEHGVNHIDDYIRLFKEHKTDIALPHLILIVDEFAELKSEYPDFMKELISAARIGRSLGVHLILATQKPSGVVNDQIWSNSRFKLCLKVQNKGDSNEVLKSPLAAEIREPGRAYLQVGNNEIFQLFQSAYSGAPAKSGSMGASDRFCLYSLNTAGKRSLLYERKPPKREDGETQLAELVSYVAHVCEEQGIKRLSPICLPPLPEKISYPQQTARTERTDICVAVGVTDDPARQRTYTEFWNLTQNNVFILGASQSGKTNLLQDVIRGLSSAYTPEEVQIYIMDFASMILRSYETLAHVGGVVTLADEERFLNLLKMLTEMVETRKRRLSELGLSSYSAYRESGASEIPQVVVMLDNWLAFRNYYEAQQETFLNLCREGTAVGISVIVTTGQSGGSGYKLLSNFSKRVALHCNDSTDYSFLFEGCRMRPKDISGRGMIEQEKEYFQCQFYLAFEAEREYERIQEVRAYIGAVNARYPDSRVRKIPEMPEILTEEYLKEQFDAVRQPYTIPIGIRFDTMKCQYLDLEKKPLLGVLGEGSSGKESYLCYLIRTLLASADPVSVYLFDDRKGTYREFEAQTRYTNQLTEADEMFDAICDLAEERYAHADEAAEAPLVLAVIQSREIAMHIMKDKVRAERFKSLMPNMRGLRISFFLADIDNVPAGFGATEFQKQMKEQRHFLLFENLRDVKVIDIPQAVSRENKKPLGNSDAYLMDGSEVIRVRCICESVIRS